MTIKIGFIGAGEISFLHAQALQRLKDRVEIVGAYDIVPDNALAFCEKSGARCYPSVEQLLSSDVEAVYICTRHDSHFELVKRALDAKKAIFCEKPLALDFEQVSTMYNLVQKSGLPFAVGFNHRCTPGVVELRKRMDGLTPNILHVSMVTPPFLQGWAGLPDVGGGIMHCLGSHVLDLARYLMQDDPQEIAVFSARQRLAETHLDDTGVGILRFPGNRLVSLSFHDQGSHGYSVEPEGALMRVEAFVEGKLAVGQTLSEMIFDTRGEVQHYHVSDSEQVTSWGYLTINQRFINYLEGFQDERPASILDGLMAAKMVKAAVESQESGKIIKF